METVDARKAITPTYRILSDEEWHPLEELEKAGATKDLLVRLAAALVKLGPWHERSWSLETRDSLLGPELCLKATR